MAPQILSSGSGSNPPSSSATTAPLTTELYAFNTILLTFLGRKVALSPAPLPTPASALTTSLNDPTYSSSSPSAQTNPQEQQRLIETTAHVAAAATDADSAADIAQKAQPQTTPLASPILSATSDQLPSLALPNLVSPPSSPISSSTIPASSFGTVTSVNSANTDNNAGRSYPNLSSWVELLSPSLASPSGSGRTPTDNDSKNSNDFVGDKSTVVRDGAGERGGSTAGSIGGAGRGGGGVRVRGGITLAYQACQMLPEPIHLRHVNTTLLPFTTSSPEINGNSNSNGVSIGQDSYAIEYFADQGCTQFVMATAGTRVNVWQAELDLVESNAEKDPDNDDGGGEKRHNRRRGLRDNSFIRIGKRQLLPSPATASPPAVTATTATHIPWKPAPITKQALGELDMVVSVRWVGILKQSEFTLYKAHLASDRPSLNRVLVDPLLERRGNEDSDGNGGDGGEEGGLGNSSNIGDNNTDPRSVESVTEQDGKEFEQGAFGNNTPLPALSPLPPTPTPTLGLLQDGKNLPEANVDGVGGFVSWTSFNETQLQAPPRRDLGSFPLDDMVFNIALRGTISPLDGKRNTTTGSGTGGGGHFGIPHTTSQIVMAGLIAGLLLFLGSLLTAAYYRQRRRKWYEEDGQV